MKINVQEIKGIKISCKSSLMIDAYLEKHQIEELFYDIWDYIDDEGVNDLLEKEGYKLTKI